jgi:hypothetical protein
MHLRTRALSLFTLACIAMAWSATAAAQNRREPIIVIGLRPAKGTVNGATDIRRLGEAQKLRGVAEDAVRQIAQRPTIDDAGLRTVLGVEYLVDFMDCRGQVGCVTKLVSRLRKTATIAVYGEYTIVNKQYLFRFRLIYLGKAKVEKEVEFKLDASDNEDRKLWRRELERLLAGIPAENTTTTGGGTTGGDTTGTGTTGGTTGGTTTGGDTTGTTGGTTGGTTTGGDTTGTTGGTTGGTTTGGTTTGGTTTGGTTTGGTTTGGTTTGGTTTGGTTGTTGGVPELAPLSTDGEGSGSGAGSNASTSGDTSPEPFIDSSVLDAIRRGISWHGHFQNYTAVGARRGFWGDLVTFENRLQLEFESDINQVRVIGKPQLINDVNADTLDVQFRELYAARDYKRGDFSLGQQIVTWGITDFWPVVDIINGRDFSQIRNWRPIDEKIPVPLLRATYLLGPLTFHLLGAPALGQSKFEIDQTKPFAIPVPAPPGTTIEQAKVRPGLDNAGGGARVDLAGGGWKLSLYGMLGRDPLPSVRAQLHVVDSDITEPTTFIVDNDRVAMAAVSLQGNLDFLGALLKTEAAAYQRLRDDCEGQTDTFLTVPVCFYIRRVPTGRANVAIEKHVMTNLEAHLQFITEYTRAKDVPHLPAATSIVAPGLPDQYAVNKIVTLRLQGNYKKGDFRPMVFAYWAVNDEAFFVNADLEYHVADGFSLALGGFGFHGYATDKNKNKYTLAGSLEKSSNVYLRATAFF